jgi:uncharacterized Zn finger protein
MTEKLTLRYCKDCGEDTIHISKKEYDEVENFSRVIHRCLTCGKVVTKIVDHNLHVINTSKDTLQTCYECGRIIQDKGYTVDDTMGMSGMMYHFCDRKCSKKYGF